MVKNYFEIALSLTVFEINDIFNFRQHSRWPTKFWNFNFFTSTISKVSSTQRVQTLLEITLSLRVFEINDTFNLHQNSRWQPKSRSQDKYIFAFYAGNSRWPPKNGGKVIFAKCGQYTLQIPCGSKIFVEVALSHTVSEVNTFFTQKFKRVAKSGGKAIFAKKWPVHSADTLWVQNFCRNRSISHRF